MRRFFPATLAFKGAALAFALLLLLAAGAAADDTLRVRPTMVDASAYPMVRVRLTAADGGSLPPDLDKTSFRVSAPGSRRVPISGLESIVEGQTGVSAALVIDSSGSMAGAPIAAARDAARAFLDRLGPEDEVALLTFADSVRVASAFTGDKEAARQAVAAIAAQGNTALYQAVADASSLARTRGSPRKVILLLSDGADYGSVSQTSRQRSLDSARDAGIAYYVIGLGSSIDRSYLQELANATSGRLLTAPTPSQLQAAFREVAQLVKTEYLLTLDFTDLPYQGETPVRLTLTSGSQSAQADLVLQLPLAIPGEIGLPAPPAASRFPTAVLWPLAGLVMLGVLVALVRRRLRRRPRRQRRELPAPPLAPGLIPAPAAPPPGSAGIAARLVLHDGAVLELSGTLTELAVDEEKGLRRPAASADLATGSLRIWPSNERFLFNAASSRTRVQLNGRAVSWGVLSDGDELELAGVRVRFELAAAQPAL